MSLSLLTTGTAAFFSNNSKVNTTISSANDWWDKSDLEFTKNGTTNIKECGPVEIFAELKNIGLDMTKKTEFEVYYIKNGNPKNGKKVDGGDVEPLNSNETGQITFLAEEEGSYAFKVYQREGYDNDYENRQEIWSGKIQVKCLPNMKSEELD